VDVVVVCVAKREPERISQSTILAHVTTRLHNCVVTHMKFVRPCSQWGLLHSGGGSLASF
jgi:hypothetical protein